MAVRLNDNKWNGGDVLTSQDLNDTFGRVNVPVGTILAWAKNLFSNPTLPDNWVECNGQVVDDPESPLNGVQLPDLNGATGNEPQRFLRGSTTGGATGGSETHVHNNQLSNCTRGNGYGGYEEGCSNIVNASASTLPSYYEVVWIIKIK